MPHVWGECQIGPSDGWHGRAATWSPRHGGWPCRLKHRCVTIARRWPARCVAPRFSRLDVSAFARQLTVKRPGGVDIQPRFRPYQHTHRDRRPSINAQSATAATSVISIAATARGSAVASAWVDFVRRATSQWPSAICYPTTSSQHAPWGHAPWGQRRTTCPPGIPLPSAVRRATLMARR